tara:strand:- start:592 stop:699 length:108 start_codon:yes stop_codon:yes gene_type:complete
VNKKMPIMDSSKVMKLIPHRYPFLMVVRLEEVEDE